MNKTKLITRNVEAQALLRENLRDIQGRIDLGDHWPDVQAVTNRARGPKREAQELKQFEGVATSIVLVLAVLAQIPKKQLADAASKVRAQLDAERESLEAAKAAEREESERKAREAEEEIAAAAKRHLDQIEGPESVEPVEPAGAPVEPTEGQGKPEGEKAPEDGAQIAPEPVKTPDGPPVSGG